MALAGTAAVALALTGCSDGPGTTTSASGAADGGAAGATSIQFVNPLPNYPAWRLIGDCMADEAKTRGSTSPRPARPARPWTRRR